MDRQVEASKILLQRALPRLLLGRQLCDEGLILRINLRILSRLLHGGLRGNLALGRRDGVTRAALGLSQRGDAVNVTPDELNALIGQTNRLGTVQR